MKLLQHEASGAVTHPAPHATQLIRLVHAAPWLMDALRAARALRLASWCIGAGAIRTLVWDHLHGRDVPSDLADIDVVFFDAADLSSQQERLLASQLAQAVPDVAWEVVNQAAVHRWFLQQRGQDVPPLSSLAEGVASWPEYATCVGVYLDRADEVQVIAPHGLEDLFQMVVRWNPMRASAADYAQRVTQKRFAQRWPLVEVMPPGENSSSS